MRESLNESPAPDISRATTTALAPRARRYGLLATALAPVIPQLLGSAFNIWYNAVVIEPLLITNALRRRFFVTVVVYNVLVYPLAIALWIWIIRSLRPVLRKLITGQTVASANLDRARCRLINLPWIGAAISAVAWLGCIPVFLGALIATGDPVHSQLLWHLPISFIISAFIAVTQTFFLIEIASYWGLFPAFFRDARRPNRIPGAHPVSLRTRGLMWAVSAGVCPIAALLLLMFAPPSPSMHPQWFAVFVGAVGVAFGLCSAALITRLVAKPVDELRGAFRALGEGNLQVHLPLRRADEFGGLVGDFNQMVLQLRDKERLRRAFGLHVGRKVAEQILRGDPELGGREQLVTVIFADLRNFTARAAQSEPKQIVGLLNRFLQTMVAVVENEHGGIVNKFLGDGFMALFGLGEHTNAHADESLSAARAMLRGLERLNAELAAAAEAPLEIGIGINSGRAIVGSIGSPERMEFTVIGNTVNVASRLENLNKTLGTSLLLSSATRELLRDENELIALPPQQLRGVGEAMPVFTLAEFAAQLQKRQSTSR